MVDGSWIAAFSTKPAEAINHPDIAVPIPPPTLMPKDEQEYIVPSIRFPVVRKVYSEHEAIKAFKSHCRGLVPSAAIPVKSNMDGILPI